MDASNTRTETVTLFRTKLHMPRHAADLNKRPHLLAHLDRGLNHKLTLVSAPAGYGKTTLIATWLQDSSRAVAWLPLDKHDNDEFSNYAIIS